MLEAVRRGHWLYSLASLKQLFLNVPVGFSVCVGGGVLRFLPVPCPCLQLSVWHKYAQYVTCYVSRLMFVSKLMVRDSHHSHSWPLILSISVGDSHRQSPFKITLQMPFLSSSLGVWLLPDSHLTYSYIIHTKYIFDRLLELLQI